LVEGQRGNKVLLLVSIAGITIKAFFVFQEIQNLVSQGWVIFLNCCLSNLSHLRCGHVIDWNEWKDSGFLFLNINLHEIDMILKKHEMFQTIWQGTICSNWTLRGFYKCILSEIDKTKFSQKHFPNFYSPNSTSIGVRVIPAAGKVRLVDNLKEHIG